MRARGQLPIAVKIPGVGLRWSEDEVRTWAELCAKAPGLEPRATPKSPLPEVMEAAFALVRKAIETGEVPQRVTGPLADLCRAAADLRRAADDAAQKLRRLP